MRRLNFEAGTDIREGLMPAGLRTPLRQPTYDVPGGASGMLLQKYQVDLIIAGLIFLLGFVSAYCTMRSQLAVANRRTGEYQQRLQTVRSRTATVAQRLEALERYLADCNGRGAGLALPEQIRSEIQALKQLMKNNINYH
jgi:hypothetical protein